MRGHANEEFCVIGLAYVYLHTEKLKFNSRIHVLYIFSSFAAGKTKVSLVRKTPEAVSMVSRDNWKFSTQNISLKTLSAY
jgi:hypothetical protein